MKLIGSQTSPFVRRIRLQLGDAPYIFEKVDLLSETGHAVVLAQNPIGKIPVFIDGDLVLWDSRIIAQHLSKKRQEAWSQKLELELDLINAATDSGVLLMQFRKFKVDPDWKNHFSQMQVARLHHLLSYFSQFQWKQLPVIQEQWLFCLLDWLLFREIAELPEKLAQFHQAYSSMPFVQETDPRQT